MKALFIDLFGKPFGIVIFQLLEATQFTIYLSLIAFIGGGLIGAVLAGVQTGGNRRVNRLCAAYVWLFQSTPLLMLLFLLGLGIPRILGMDINPWVAAIIALTFYASAYLSAVWHGALIAIPIGQWESGKALGLSFLLTLRLIIAPQAIRLSLAPTVGFMVQIIKGTSLAYIIGFHDLMSIGKRWANAPVDGTEPFVIYPMMAAIYFALCFPLSVISRRLERRFNTDDREEKPDPVLAAG